MNKIKQEALIVDDVINMAAKYINLLQSEIDKYVNIMHYIDKDTLDKTIDISRFKKLDDVLAIFLVGNREFEVVGVSDTESVYLNIPTFMSDILSDRQQYLLTQEHVANTLFKCLKVQLNKNDDLLANIEHLQTHQLRIKEFLDKSEVGYSNE